MKVPLTVELISTNLECYEDTLKSIKYKIINSNRFPVTDIQVKIKTVKEDGSDTTKNYCKSVTGSKHRLMPKDHFDVTCTIKMPKDYKPKEEDWGEPIGQEVW